MRELESQVRAAAADSAALVRDGAAIPLPCREQLTGERPSCDELGAALPLEDWLTRLQQLLGSAALPAWGAACSVRSASWAAVIGVGPIAAGTVVGIAVVSGTLDATPVSSAAPSRPALASPAPALAAGTRAAPATPTASEQKPGAELAAAASSAQAEREPAQLRSLPEPPERRARAAEVVTRARTRHATQEPEAELGEAALAEMREVALAERLLASDPARALTLARTMQQRFPNGYFAEERAYLEVMALSELGRASELRSRAAAYLREFPLGLYAERVRRALARAGD